MEEADRRPEKILDSGCVVFPLYRLPSTICEVRNIGGRRLLRSFDFDRVKFDNILQQIVVYKPIVLHSE